ncbi:MAG: hypothetical protein QM763_25235 [Agriterribacter sp.]
MKSGIKQDMQASGFKDRKSYSPEEIWAAGGTTAFGKKKGQSNEKLIEALEASPKIEPFNEKEWMEALEQLEQNK